MNTKEFRTEERYKEYKDCGFDILKLDRNTSYHGNTSDEKKKAENALFYKVLDIAAETGLKVIVFDERIHWLSKVNGSLIGADFDASPLPKQYFASFGDLVDKMRSYLEDYIHHPAFLGVILFDEPTYNRLCSTGEVYRAIKMVDKNILVHSELACYLWSTEKEYFTGEGKHGATLKDYEVYLEKFLDVTESSYIDYDSYPLLVNKAGTPFVIDTFVKNMQLVNSKVKEKDSENGGFTMTIASSNLILPVNSLRTLTERDIRWEANMALSFGAKNLSYYTYWEHAAQGAKAYVTQAMIKRDGEKDLYDVVKKINAELQALAKVLLNFEYVGTAYFWDARYSIGPVWLKGYEEFELKKLIDITDVKVSGQVIINKMYDKQKNLYGYMILNGVDPVNRTIDEVSLAFDNKYKNIMLINRGRTQIIDLEENKYNFYLESGDSSFIIPY